MPWGQGVICAGYGQTVERGLYDFAEAIHKHKEVGEADTPVSVQVERAICVVYGLREGIHEQEEVGKVHGAVAVEVGTLAPGRGADQGEQE